MPYFDSPNFQDSFNLASFCGMHVKYTMWKFIADVVHDFGSSLQPDVGRGFLHVSNVFLFSGILRSAEKLLIRSSSNLGDIFIMGFPRPD